VVDAAPPGLSRRGAARARAGELSSRGTGLSGELAARGVVRRSLLRRLGVPTEPVPEGARSVGDWLVAADRWRDWYDGLVAAVGAAEDGLSPAAAAHLLDLPDAELATALVAPPLRLVSGRIVLGTGLSEPLRDALVALRAELARGPFEAPAVDRLTELGIDRATLARLGRSGELLLLADGVVLLPGADDEAARAAGRPGSAVHDERGAAGARDQPPRGTAPAGAPRPDRPHRSAAGRPSPPALIGRHEARRTCDHGAWDARSRWAARSDRTSRVWSAG
jgi:hypothetical protein